MLFDEIVKSCLKENKILEYQFNDFEFKCIHRHLTEVFYHNWWEIHGRYKNKPFTERIEIEDFNQLIIIDRTKRMIKRMLEVNDE